MKKGTKALLIIELPSGMIEGKCTQTDLRHKSSRL